MNCCGNCKWWKRTYPRSARLQDWGSCKHPMAINGRKKWPAVLHVDAAMSFKGTTCPTHSPKEEP